MHTSLCWQHFMRHSMASTLQICFLHLCSTAGHFIEVKITYIRNNFRVGDGEGRGGGVMVPALQSHNYTIGESIVPRSIPAVYDVPICLLRKPCSNTSFASNLIRSSPITLHYVSLFEFPLLHFFIFSCKFWKFSATLVQISAFVMI